MATEDVAEDVVAAAIEDLYSIDPDDFMLRRTELASAARATDKPAAKRIAALRKPTRAAYVLNRLVRDDPAVADRLAELGDGLLAAQKSLDGVRMRELSTLRRGLIDEFADQASAGSPDRSPPPALREEAVATLNAAVADRGVLDQLRTGTLLRSARWDGFGFASAPELSVVRPAASRPPQPESAVGTTPAARQAETGGSGGRSAGRIAGRSRTRGPAGTVIRGRTAQTAGKGEAREAVRAEQQQRRSALAAAHRAVKQADAALDKASRAEDQQHTRVRLLHEQLTDARRRLDEFRLDVRRAENRQRKAQAALDRQQK